MKYQLLTASALVLATALGAPALAETTSTTTTVTTKPAISSDATVTHKSGYVAYDMDGDGVLEPDEYTTYSYNVIDRDGDKYITDSEWSDYTTVWYEPLGQDLSKIREFAELDTNADGKVDFEEYKAKPEVNLFSGWDTDGDGFINDTEYTTVITRYKTVDTGNLYNW